jgi:hypothetical protein
MLTKIKFTKQSKFTWIIAIIIISIPTFFAMLRTGIYSMQDFPYFRLVEYGKCLSDFQIPCRWSPDAGLGFGEPLFNFYGQASYFIGGMVHLFGFSYINSLKFLFILSLVASGISMFYLAKRIWNDNWAALLSSVVYLYAPYRAVDVWVRGALPEAMSFVIIPLVVLQLDELIETRKTKNLLWFSIFSSLLVLNHNLSVLIFAPFLITWTLYRLVQSNKLLDIAIKIGVAVFISLLLSSFYLLPVLFESQYISLDSTIQGYFDFRAHFVTIPQLIFSRFWGYGGSTWGNEDGLSLSIGQVQWVLPLLVFPIAFFKHSYSKLKSRIMNHESAQDRDKSIILYPFCLILLGWFGLFLTHNKAAFLWEAIAPMAYIQFPWRFLMLSLLSFSLASGAIVLQFKKYKQFITIFIIVLTIVLNFSFFKEDIWFHYTDSDLTTGKNWIEQTRASIGDYWPISRPIQIQSSSFLLGDNNATLHTTNKILYTFEVSRDTPIVYQVNYFPGWKAFIDTKEVPITPNDDGFITVTVPEGRHNVLLEFVNTPVRTIGNILSIMTLLGIYLYYLYYAKK